MPCVGSCPAASGSVFLLLAALAPCVLAAPNASQVPNKVAGKVVSNATEPLHVVTSCPLLELPHHIVVIAIPGAHGEFQVLHKQGDGTFIHYGRVLAKKDQKTLQHDFTWVGCCKGSEEKPSWEEEPQEVFLGRVNKLSPWEPLGLRDCQGNLISSFVAANISDVDTTHLQKFEMYGNGGVHLGYSGTSKLDGNVYFYDTKNSRVAAIHPHDMSAQQQITVYEGQRRNPMADLRMLVFFAANKALIGDTHDNVSADKSKNLEFLLKVCGFVAMLLVLMACGCVICYKMSTSSNVRPGDLDEDDEARPLKRGGRG